MKYIYVLPEVKQPDLYLFHLGIQVLKVCGDTIRMKEEVF